MNTIDPRQSASSDERHGEESIDLLAYWLIVWRERYQIAALVTVVALVAYVFARSLTPIYSASATLLIESTQANVVSIEEIYGIDASQREYFSTQFEILGSRKLAEKAVSKLDLVTHPEYQSSLQDESFVRRLFGINQTVETPSEEEQAEVVLSKFRGNLSIEPIRGTHLVLISFESSDPELTFRAANALGESYIENYLESRVEMTEQAGAWLTNRLGSMRQELEDAEKRLQAFRERENLVDVSGVATLSEKEIDQLSQNVVVARRALTEARNQLDSVGEDSENYNSRWETFPSVLQDSLSQRLKETETRESQELTELSQRYGPKHPKHIAAQSSLNRATQAYEAQVKKVISGLREQYQQAQASLQEAERELTRSRSEIQGINRKQYELSQLEREVQATRQLYDLFFTRFQETNSESFQAANARFIDRAHKPQRPVKPRTLIIAFLAAVFAGAFAVGLALLRDLLDKTIKSSGEVETKLNQTVIGVLPQLSLSKKRKRAMSEAVFDSEERFFGEAVRTLRTGVVLSGIDSPLKKLVVTSSLPGEGKTTSSMNLAFAFGQIEKVVLLDADMRRPSVAENCHLAHRTPGLSNIIAETDTLENCTYEYQGIDVIPAGVVPPNPLELLSSKRFDDLLRVLADKYDRVIIDSAPTQAVSDSMVLSTHVDGVLYVVKSDATAAQIAQEGLNRLARVNAHILGVVLNQFDPTS
ncbi:MAG: polysaccharide biosynthesis tyrosine autokinase, partial [Pseudomonadales bacterium]|nr:polysaccharide biosynthesis tyrosine autokinase [Pseudomonadales bacterium]